MGAKCCSCSKGSVKEDSVISVAEHREQGRDLREMETEETRNDTGSSEHESPTSDLRTLEVLEKFSSVSVGLQAGTSRIRESPRSLGEDWMSSSNILWSTDSFSGPIPSGYYSVIPDKRLTHFKTGQLETKRMRRSPSATPENSDAIARAMRVSNSSKQSRFSKEGDSSPHSSDDITRGESSNQNINDILNEVLGSPTFQNKPLLPYDEWNIDISEVKVGALIGRGCFGKVYRGSWSGTDVAIKVFLEQDLIVENIKDFCNEISILSRLRHPNVILFLGACTKPPQLLLVTELMENGSLYNKLYSPGEKKEFSWKRKRDMLRDICKGLMCIHRMGIVHRDLKSANCLLSDQGKVKICDFGLSRIMKDMTMKNTEPAGTPEWMAPELIRNEPFSQKCDIFSFGVIMWELCTLTKPWKGVLINRVIHTVANEGARLEIPDGPLCKLIAACWSEPEQRPSCKEILAELTICEYSL